MLGAFTAPVLVRIRRFGRYYFAVALPARQLPRFSTGTDRGLMPCPDMSLKMPKHYVTTSNKTRTTRFGIRNDRKLNMLSISMHPTSRSCHQLSPKGFVQSRTGCQPLI